MAALVVCGIHQNWFPWFPLRSSILYRRDAIEGASLASFEIWALGGRLYRLFVPHVRMSVQKMCIQSVWECFLMWHTRQYAGKTGNAIFVMYTLWRVILNPSCSGVVLNNRRYAGTGEKYVTQGVCVRRKRIDKCTDTHRNTHTHRYTQKHTHAPELVCPVPAYSWCWVPKSPDMGYQLVRGFPAWYSTCIVGHIRKTKWVL